MSIDVTFDDDGFEMQVTSRTEHLGKEQWVQTAYAWGRSTLQSVPHRDRSQAHPTRHGIRTRFDN